MAVDNLKSAGAAVKYMDDNRKHHLGHRAFFLFFWKRLGGLVVMALVIVGWWYVGRWLPADWLPWWGYGLEVVSLIGVAYLLIALFRTYLEYRFYSYTFTEEAFIITYGVMVRNEQAALYHQIQNVSVRRGVADRLVGVSSILIFLDGDESGHAKIVLPAVEKKKAKLVQKELLIRARRSVVGQ
jgi:membrane protein YdbS with pleckstrin-like domain